MEVGDRQNGPEDHSYYAMFLGSPSCFLCPLRPPPPPLPRVLGGGRKWEGETRIVSARMKVGRPFWAREGERDPGSPGPRERSSNRARLDAGI